MFGLIGKKLSHSYSKIIHEQLNPLIEYKLIELDSLNSFFLNENIDGLNVTIPYKTEVIKHLDSLDSIAKSIGVVNTIVKEEGLLKGYNTDYFGLEYLLDFNNISVKDKNVIVLGNGSTSRTIQYYCRVKKALKVTVLARNPNADEYYFEHHTSLKDTSIIFNATPLGMFPNNDESFSMDLNTFNNLECVVDLIYNPLRTWLLLSAESLNIKAVNGLMMLVAQAVKAASLFYKKEYNDSTILEIYLDSYEKIVNIIFIGMPMSGKTFVTKQVSNYYEKEFVDTDKMIVTESQKSIENIFKFHGEKHFRNLEFEVVRKLYKTRSLAVSCGGGLVLNKTNIDLLKQNGIVIFLDASMDFLLTRNPRNRPLLASPKALSSLYNKRYDLYVEASDVIVNKNTTDDAMNLSLVKEKVNEYINS